MPALFYLCTGEPKYLRASHNAFRWFDENHMLPFGVTSGEKYLAGIGVFRLTETCDVAASLWSMTWLYRIEGQRDWGDRIERALFNAAPAPIARDFQTMCYYQSPNRIAADSLPEEQSVSPGRGSLRFTALKAPARTFNWRPTDENPLPAAPVEGDKDETIRLVPYGCTKFRISMFPVTPRAWRQEPPAAAAEPER